MELRGRIVELGHRYAHLSDLRRAAYWDAKVSVYGEIRRASVFVGVPRRAKGRLFVRLWFGKQRWSGWSDVNWGAVVLRPTKAVK